MPRPLWKGAVQFGMVTIPIKVYTGTEEKDVHFNQLHIKDMSRIRQKRYCAEEDVEVDSEDIVKGYEITKGQYVVMEEEDFEKVRVESTRTISIESFVDAAQIDPIHYQKTYFLEPDEVGKKPFALLMKALESTERIAIAKVTLRQKEQLCTLRVYKNTIAMETMFYADEVRSTTELEVPDEDLKINDRDLTMAKSLIDMLYTEEFDLSEYKDEYREGLLELIKAKYDGHEIEDVAAPVAAKITDLTEALRASVEKAKREGRSEEP